MVDIEDIQRSGPVFRAIFPDEIEPALKLSSFGEEFMRRREMLSRKVIEIRFNKTMKALNKAMKELQKLFARLKYTKRAWVDPADFLAAIRYPDGRPYQVGNQEDVSEFNDLFLTIVSQGLHLRVLFLLLKQLEIVQQGFPTGTEQFQRGPRPSQQRAERPPVRLRPTSS